MYIFFIEYYCLRFVLMCIVITVLVSIIVMCDNRHVHFHYCPVPRLMTTINTRISSSCEKPV